MAIATSLEIDGVTKTIVSGKTPIRGTSALEWGGDCPLGVLSQNVTLTLPAIAYNDNGYAGDITISAYQPSGGSYTITMQVGNTSSETITDGETNTTTVIYTPTASNNIIINVKPVAVNQVSALSVEREGKPVPIGTLTNQPVGGRIFYVNPDAADATYTFYDSSHNVISDQTVSGLASATTYDMAYYVDPTSSGFVDKFYAYDTNGAFSATYNSAPSTISSKNSNMVGGCNDWYFPDQTVVNNLRLSGLVSTWFTQYWTYGYIISSTSTGTNICAGWNGENQQWVNINKAQGGYTCACRSF